MHNIHGNLNIKYHKVINICLIVLIGASLISTMFYGFRISLLFATLSALFALAINFIYSRTLSIEILNLYYILVAPMQLFLAVVSPSSIIAARYNKYFGKWMFNDLSIIEKYFIFASLFLLIGTIILKATEGVSISIYGSKVSVINDLYKKNTFYKHPIIWMIIFSLLNYYYRQGTINGVLSYFLFGLCFFGLANLVIRSMQFGLSVRSVFLIFFGLLIYAVPGILSGTRYYIVSGLILTVIYALTIESEQTIAFAKKHIPLLICILAIIVVIFGVTNIVKLSKFDPIGLFTSRIVGLFDGCSVIDYINSNSYRLSINNYIMSMINDSGVRANRFYTKTIIGYPENAHTGSAAPIFIISLLYGLPMWIIICIFYIIIFGISMHSIYTNKLKVVAEGEKYSYYDRCNVFISIYFAYTIFSGYFLDGNIEIIKLLSSPIAAWLLLRLVTIKLSKRRSS